MQKTAIQEQIKRRNPWAVVTFVTHLPHFARLFLRLLVDRRVGAGAKLLLLATLAYAVSPIDILTDFLPLLGAADDLALLGLGCRTFIHLCPQEVVREHVARIDASGEWRPFFQA